MKKLVAVALLLALFAPVAAAQTAASFTGKWEGTFTRQRPDGAEDKKRRRVQPDAEGRGARRHRGPGRTAVADCERRRQSRARPRSRCSSLTGRCSSSR